MTTDIDITVKIYYIPSKSRPNEEHFVYAYTINITNNSDLAARLTGRQWVIQDERDKRQEVRDIGVEGEHPHLAPGKSYTYTSGVVLETETGIVEGSYQMRTDEGLQFEVPIPAFALVPAHAIH